MSSVIETTYTEGIKRRARRRGGPGSRCGGLPISKRAGAEQMVLSAITGMVEISRCEWGHRTDGGALREVHICLDYPSREEATRTAGETACLSRRRGRRQK